MKLYYGKPPQDGKLAAIILHGDETWHLYVRAMQKPLIIEWKLTSDGGVQHKCSYWFGWHLRELRFVKGRTNDAGILLRGRPALRALVEQLIRELVLVYGDPRLIDSSFEPETYAATPAVPPPLGVAAGVGGGTGQNTPLSDATPAPPVLPPCRETGVTGSGEAEGGELNTLGDPDGDLL